MRREGIDQISYPLVAKTHSSMYLMHKYWARKPWNVVAEYIKHYSKEGDIVLDPFCGSGPVIVESLKNGRKAIGVDLNPIAIFSTRMTAIPVDLENFKKAFKLLEGKLRDEINSLYRYKCSRCQSHGTTICVWWSYVVSCPVCKRKVTMARARRPPRKRQNIYICPHCKVEFSYANQKLEDEVPIRIQYICPSCGKVTEDITKKDQVLASPPGQVLFPKEKFFYGEKRPFRTKRRANTFLDLFTKRNLYALYLILDEIEKLKNEKIRDLMKYMFSSMIPNASKMMIWTKSSGPSWKMPEYLIFATHCELNVWSRFENRFYKVLRGKEQSNEEIGRYKEGEKFDDLIEGDANILLLNQSALDLSNIPHNSIDYVFTDPPYGGSIQYYELDLIRLAFLSRNDNRFSTDWWRDEITINDSQGKPFEVYDNMLRTSFAQIYGVLKPERWLTVTFHSTNVQIYNSIIRAAVHAGFILETIIYQPTSVVSVKQQAQPYGSAVGDYYIRFRRPTKKAAAIDTKLDMYSMAEPIIVEAVKAIIAERGEPTTYTDLLRKIYVELDKHGFLLAAKPQQIRDTIRKYEGSEFIFIPKRGWWFKDPSKYWIDIIPLNDRVEKAVIQVLRRKHKASFDDVLKEIFLSFRNALTPNPPSVTSILEEYAEKTKDRKWRLKPSVEQNEKEHGYIIGLLAEIGKQFGYTIWIGTREQSGTFGGSTLSSFCDFEHLDYDGATVERLRFVENIDVLWIEDGNIEHAFEVENTTAITEAVNRCSNLPEQHDTRKYIVVPEERRALLFRKTNSELLKPRIQKENWRFIYYEDLKDFFEGKRGPKEFESISRRVTQKASEQATLKTFF